MASLGVSTAITGDLGAGGSAWNLSNAEGFAISGSLRQPGNLAKLLANGDQGGAIVKWWWKPLCLLELGAGSARGETEVATSFRGPEWADCLWVAKIVQSTRATNVRDSLLAMSGANCKASE